jgi:hypothetical protein
MKNGKAARRAADAAAVVLPCGPIGDWAVALRAADIVDQARRAIWAAPSCGPT